MEKTALPVSPFMPLMRIIGKQGPQVWNAFRAAYKPLAGQFAGAAGKAAPGGFQKLINPLMNVGFVGMGLSEGAKIGKKPFQSARSMELPSYNASRLQNVY